MTTPHENTTCQLLRKIDRETHVASYSVDRFNVWLSGFHRMQIKLKNSRVTRRGVMIITMEYFLDDFVSFYFIARSRQAVLSNPRTVFTEIQLKRTKNATLN